jgi:RNA polymerase sigma-70 factor (ECF subfamily)
MFALALSPHPSRAADAPRRARAGKRIVGVDSGHEDTDEGLLARVSQGDREAFAALFGAYARKVKSYLIRLGAAPAVAEDLAQDAMVSVWRRAASFDAAKAKASTWIFVIARNAWIDRLRRERVEFAYRDTLALDEESDDEAPDDAAVRGQTAVQMAAALATLSEEQRQVVQLSFFEDRPHSEIAERLSLPLGTVKSRLRLALIKLRAHWEQLG